MDYTKKHILKILRNRAFCQRTAVYINGHESKLAIFILAIVQESPKLPHFVIFQPILFLS